MSPQQSGVLSNRYVYDQMKIDDGPWKQTLGIVGGALGQALSEDYHQDYPVIPNVAEKGGTFAGEQLGILIDNRSTVLHNAQTFLEELNDWRSLSDVMGKWAGPWNGPGTPSR